MWGREGEETFLARSEEGVEILPLRLFVEEDVEILPPRPPPPVPAAEPPVLASTGLGGIQVNFISLRISGATWLNRMDSPETIIR